MLFAFADRSERNAGFDSHSLLNSKEYMLNRNQKKNDLGRSYHLSDYLKACA